MKRNLYILLALFCLQWAASIAKNNVYHLDLSFSRHDFCDTIPIVYEDGQIYIVVVVDGKLRRFNLDTGAAQGAIYGNWADSCVSELGSVVSRDAAGNDDTVRVVALPRMLLTNGLSIDHYVATCYAAGARRKYDGVIGFDLFNSGLNAKLDVSARQLIVSDRRDAFDTAEGYRLKYKLKWFVPYVRISPFVRHVDEALFDTGFRQLYTMNSQSFKVHSYKSQQVMEQVADSVYGSFAIGNQGAERHSMLYFLQLQRLDVAGFELRHVAAMTTQGSSKLGAAILDYCSVIINPRRKQLTFLPYANQESVEVNNTLPSLAFVPVDNKPTIGFVARQSNAYKAGARSGDVILSIDGKPMTSFADFLSFPFVYDRENLFLMMSRNGQMKEVRIKR